MVIRFGEVVMIVKMKMVGSCNRNQQSVWMVVQAFMTRI